MLDLYAGSKLISSAWVNVTEIRKPAYRIDVQTDRHVYVAVSGVTVDGPLTPFALA